MKLYHSHASKLLYKFEDVANISPDDLTLASTLADAVQSFLHHDISLQATRKAGKLRSHEPYCAIANGANGQLMLSEFTKKQANKMISGLYASGYSGGTINGIASKYRKLFRFLSCWDVVPGNPMDAVFKVPKTERKRQSRSLTEAEISDILFRLDACKSICVPQGTYGDMFRLGLSTAMRYNEILVLTPAMIDATPGQETITVPEQFSKTRKTREVILSPEAAALLARYAYGKAKQERLFPCGYSALQEILSKLQKQMKIPVFFHQTRHTAITEYAADCQSMSELQAFSGHATKQGVEPYCNHDRQELKDRVRAKLNARNTR